MFRLWSFALLLACLPVVSAMSQAPAARAAGHSISGLIEDPSHAVLSGATVQLWMKGALVRATATSPSGSFRFNNVADGSYELRVHEPGFSPVARRVKVFGQSPPQVVITLAIAGIEQQVTVSTAPAQISTETSENQSTASVTGEQLSNLPVFDQDYVGAMSRFLDAGDVGTGGVTLVVDGMESEDLGVSPSAIQEVKINKNPYDAQFSRPGRGRIEITTKAGQKQYHGTANFIFRDARLNARDPFALTRAPEQRKIFEGEISGPVLRSRNTSFSVSADRDLEDLQSVVFAQGPQGLIDENVPSPMRHLQVSGRIDHNVSENDRISLRYSYEDRTHRNQNVGGLTLPEAGTNTEFREDELRFGQNLVLSPRWVNEFHLLLGQYSGPTTSLNEIPQLVVQGAFIGGGAQADQLRTEHHFDLTETAAYQAGQHLLKFGVQVPDWSHRGFDNLQNRAGTFTFASLQDYQAGKPSLFTVQQGNGHLLFVEKVFGGFVQDDYRIRPNLMISTGLRYDWQNYFRDHDRFGPRLAFAWGPGHQQRTVIRGGAGIFYDRTGPRPISDLLLFNGVNLLQYNLANPSYPDPFASGQTLSAQPANLVEIGARFTSPYIIHYSLAAEQQLAKSTTLSVEYHGSRGVHSFRSLDLNQPLTPFSSTRPDPNLGIVRELDAEGLRRHEAVQFSVRDHVTRYFEGMITYRLGWAWDNTSGINSFPANSYDLAGEWARSDEDRRHRFELLGNLKPRKWFDLGVSLSLYSGQPYTITTGRDPFYDNTFNARPAGTSRNGMQGPASADLDLRWSRDFHLTRSKEKGPTTTIALDAFNVLNTVNYHNPVGVLTSPFFGRPVSADPPRRLQLGVRYKF